MTGSATPDPRCQAIHDDLAALATGTLTGRERAAVLDHLEHCPYCVAELEELSAVADELMTLVPEVAPPDGFAERTVALMKAEPKLVRPPARQPAFRRVLAVAAAVVVLALGVGIGAVIASPGSTGSGGNGSSGGRSGVRTAALQSTSGAQGTVVLAGDHPGWMVMTVDDSSTWGTVTCRVTLADGSHRVVGRFAMSSGYGSWTARLPVPSSSVRSVHLVGHGGAVIASAQLTS
ncbi:MAG TPA: zf-HC2 domain-containing protein [Acidimicrobiales bacterium]|nr:zf-HC2 domain-containing protein [Acidimicrobiales bacterium]